MICLCAQFEAVLQHGLRKSRGLALTAAALKQAAGFSSKTEAGTAQRLTRCSFHSRRGRLNPGLWAGTHNALQPLICVEETAITLLQFGSHGGLNDTDVSVGNFSTQLDQMVTLVSLWGLQFTVAPQLSQTAASRSQSVERSTLLSFWLLFI